MGGTKKTSVKTVSLAVKKPAAATFGYIGHVTRNDLVRVYVGAPNSEVTQLNGPQLAAKIQGHSEIITGASTVLMSKVDPMTDISERTNGNIAKGWVCLYPASWTVKEGHFINDASQDVYKNQAGHFTCDIDGVPMKGIAFTMSTAQANVDIKFNRN